MNKNKLIQLFSDDPEMLAILQNSGNDQGFLHQLVLATALYKGKDGYTPVKGKDYLSEEEIAAIRQEILEVATPNDERLQNLIIPLIPEPLQGEPGKDADEKKIAKQVLAAMPIPDDGKDGKDGSPDTATQIAEKLNSLEGVLDAKVIKDLPDFSPFEKRLGSLEKSNTLNPKGKIDQRYHGGGLSKVSHDATLSGSGTPADPLIVVGGGSGITSINTDTTAAQLLVTGTAGTNFAIADNGTGTHTFNLPIASATNTGKLSNTDWTTFNNKGSGTVTSVSGTSNRVSSTGGATPVIDIDAAYVGQASITTLGTVATGTWSATTIALNKGGTGQTTKAPAFDALSPMTTGGDIIYGGASGTGTRLANGAAGQVLTSGGTTVAPTWATPTTGTVTSVSGTASRVSVASGTTTPVIDIDASYAGQNSITIVGLLATGGVPASLVRAGTFGTGSYVIDTRLTTPQVINTANVVTVTSNAGTVPVTSKINNFTNSSATGMTVTLATSGAVDGQTVIVRTYDFSAAAQPIAWVLTENSTVTPNATSNGSTTLPKTDGFQWNGATSRWRCIASA